MVHRWKMSYFNEDDIFDKKVHMFITFLIFNYKDELKDINDIFLPCYHKIST